MGGVIVLLLAIMFAVLIPLWSKHDYRVLTDLGFIKGTCLDSEGSTGVPASGCVAWRGEPGVPTAELAAAVPHLADLHGRLELSLAGTEVDNIESLSDLDSLEALDLTGTRVWN